jgi:hypothetical protein
VFTSSALLGILVAAQAVAQTAPADSGASGSSTPPSSSAAGSGDATVGGSIGAGFGAEDDDTAATPSASATVTSPPADSSAAPATPPAPTVSADTGVSKIATTTPGLTPEEEAQAAALEAQLAQTDISSSGDDGYKLDLYGFADVMYSRQLNNFALGIPYDTFAVGRFNLYAASELGDNWRSLTEVRFTYLPHGVTSYDATGTPHRQDNTVGDYTDLNRPIRWGGIVLERAWVEYTVHPLLNVRMGHWLTPYGIWNVDHGSPVIIGVRRPFIVGESLFPTSQTGFEFHGIHNFEGTQLGYHLTLSNGRGPLDAYQDLDKNKAVGARVFARHDMSWGAITIGASTYRGTYTDRGEQFATNPDGSFRTDRPKTAEYDEFSLALDAKVEAGGFLFQMEAIENEVKYKNGLRPVDFAFSGGSQGFFPDYRRDGIYGLTGYRFKWLGVMPWAGIEYYKAPPGQFAPRAHAFWGGFNFRPTPRVVVKTQYTYSWFSGNTAYNDEHFNNIDLQVAWSF